MLAPAIKCPQSRDCFPRKNARPTGSVRMSSLFVKRNGKRNAFHALRNSKTASKISAGMVSGITTCRIIASGEAPSIRAASSMSRGMLSMNCVIINTPNGVTSHGTMSAQYVSSHPNATISLYIGIITTCAGRMSTLSTVPNQKFLNRKSRRANT